MIYPGFRFSSGNVLRFTASLFLLVLPVAFGDKLDVVRTQIQTVKNEQICVEKDNQRLQRLYEESEQNVAAETKNLEQLVDNKAADKLILKALMEDLKASHGEEATLLKEVTDKKNESEALKFQIALAQHEIKHFQDKRVQGYIKICKGLLERKNNTSMFSARSLNMRKLQNNAMVMGQEMLLERMKTALTFNRALNDHLTVQIENNNNVLQWIKEEITNLKQHIHNTQALFFEHKKTLENIKTNIKKLKFDLFVLNGKTIVLLNELESLKQTVAGYDTDQKCYSQMFQIDA